jgi:carbamoyl-phosphate synthase small subunit
MMTYQKPNRKLVLENGMSFEGVGFGALVDKVGEVVFTTAMTGYQESLTDPSYHQQILVFSFPLIGNYGVNPFDFESLRPSVAGVIVGEHCDQPSHFQQSGSVDDYLKTQSIPALSGIDTRALVRVLRSAGTLRGVICDIADDVNAVVVKLKQAELKNHVREVSTVHPYAVPSSGYRVVVVDYGMKKSILQALNQRHCNIVVVPYNTSYEAIMALEPEGVMLTNGPGDPSSLPESIAVVKELIGQVPLFGICLGHQLFALANGARTYKMPFGHRGANHPVKDLMTNRLHITSQNHGYAVDEASLVGLNLQVTHRALNDDSIEGLAHTIHPAFSVQYHPESSPGPDDNDYLFDRFVDLIAQHKKTKGAQHA